MMTFLLVTACLVFLFGLIQWARSGALLLDIHRLLRYGSAPNAEDGAANTFRERDGKKESLRQAIQSMEMTMDGLLRSSFKLLGILALCVWIFVVFSVVSDMMGLDWLDRLTFSANRVLGNPTVRASGNRNAFNRSNMSSASSRNDRFRSFGTGVRR